MRSPLHRLANLPIAEQLLAAFGIACVGVALAAVPAWALGADLGTFPDWVEAVGTSGALLLGVLALAHELERRHADDLEQEWRTARQVVVTQFVHTQGTFNAETGTIEAPWTGVKSFVRVTNDSADPIQRCRVKVYVAGRESEPQALGVVRPGESAEHETFIRWDGARSTDDANAWARFYDSRGVAWLRDARGELRKAEDDLDDWVRPADLRET